MRTCNSIPRASCNRGSKSIHRTWCMKPRALRPPSVHANELPRWCTPRNTPFLPSPNKWVHVPIMENFTDLWKETRCFLALWSLYKLVRCIALFHLKILCIIRWPNQQICYISSIFGRLVFPGIIPDICNSEVSIAPPPPKNGHLASFVQKYKHSLTLKAQNQLKINEYCRNIYAHHWVIRER